MKVKINWEQSGYHTRLIDGKLHVFRIEENQPESGWFFTRIMHTVSLKGQKGQDDGPNQDLHKPWETDR